MDWAKLFLSAEGRIATTDYWVGVAILIAIWIVSHLAHIFAPLIWLILVYPWVCVVAKRLHDFNRTGWMILVPMVVHVMAIVAAGVAGGAALIGALVTSANDQGTNIAWNWANVLGAVGIAMVFLGIGALVNIVFLLWVGLHRGDAAANRYGPPPGLVAAAPPPPATTA